MTGFIMLEPPAPAKKPAVARVNSFLARVAWRALVALFWFTWGTVRRFPRAAAVTYGVAWVLLDVPMWADGGAWWVNGMLVAANPVPVAAGVRAWWEMSKRVEPTRRDGRVAMWDTVMAAPHEGTNW